MSKAVLIMDMPDECCHCEFIACNSNGEFVCIRDKDFHGELNIYKKPDWCSLIPEPEKHATYDNKHEHSADYYLGWNACIDALEGNNKDGNK